MAISLNTGKIKFPIEFDNGEKTAIYFNPNDPSLPIRLKDFEKLLAEKIDNIEDIRLTLEGTPEKIDQVEIFRNMQNVVFEELNTAFDSDISSVVFKHCSPFAWVDGEYFIVQFINALTPEIEKHIKKATEKMSKHLKKYIK